MFQACTSLTTPSALPATTLAKGCYLGMFINTALTAAPALPATTLAESCYYQMFQNNPNLVSSPALTAASLPKTCYYKMFVDCPKLVTVGDISATTTGESSCKYMFMNCTSLTTAPALPATTLAMSCYEEMFSGCTALNYVKCLATNLGPLNGSVYSATTNWLKGVPASGTFVKADAMESWQIGTIDGIPTGWTVVNNTNVVTANSDGESNYWATYYNEAVGYTADENATVYTAKVSGDKSQVELTEVTDKTIPAGNAVVMKSTAGTITLTATDATGTLSNNDLQGQSAPFTTPTNLYALQKGTSGVGFYLYPTTSGSNPTTFPAQKAYLIVSDAAARPFLGFGTDDGETTAIGGINANEENGNIYDLTGRRVTGKATPGIYVKNGKKIIIK